jgi:hypothetical protein
LRSAFKLAVVMRSSPHAMVQPRPLRGLRRAGRRGVLGPQPLVLGDGVAVRRARSDHV